MILEWSQFIITIIIITQCYIGLFKTTLQGIKIPFYEYNLIEIDRCLGYLQSEALMKKEHFCASIIVGMFLYVLCKYIEVKIWGHRVVGFLNLYKTSK